MEAFYAYGLSLRLWQETRYLVRVCVSFSLILTSPSLPLPQGGFPGALDSVRGTRHHGLVERVHRDRNQRINLPHRRPIDKHGRQISFHK